MSAAMRAIPIGQRVRTRLAPVAAAVAAAVAVLIAAVACTTTTASPSGQQSQQPSQKQNPGQSKSEVLKQKQATTQAVMVQADYIEAFSLMLGNSSDANFYRELSRKCAMNAGLKDPSPPVADCGSTNCAKVTPTELACPNQ